ncbi:MAG: agmatine deiminase family protein [Myxococcota bacterium]|nr:agmatine deiminase family protein [Myxococcota bacterium]
MYVERTSRFNNNVSHIAWLLSVGVLVAGCELGSPPLEVAQPILSTDNIPTSPLPSEELLPAFETNTEKQGKADGNDPRNIHPAYAFTAAPPDEIRMPAEYETAQVLLLAWDDNAWALQSFFIEIIQAAHLDLQVVVYIESNVSAMKLYSVMTEAGIDIERVALVIVELDSVWMRDFGPLVVKDTDGAYRIMDLRYFWGRFADDVLPTRIGASWKIDVHRPPLENEGGNFQSDGMGRCISTERVLSRNGALGHTRDSLKQVYREYFGCSVTVFLPELEGEGTGHIDMYATITGAGEVMVGQYTEWDDPINAPRLDQAAKTLQDAGFTVRRIPMPMNTDGYYRSYTNALAINKTVLVPVYRDDMRYQDEALSIFQTAYPERNIVPIDATEVIRVGGAIHCVTQTVAY